MNIPDFLDAGTITSIIAVIGAVIFVVRTNQREQSEAEERAREAWQSLAEAAQTELETARQQRDAYQEALDQAREETSDQKARIAALEERPDTKQMLETFDNHHQENLAIMRTVAQTLQEVVGNQADLQALVQLTLDRPGRATDPHPGGAAT